jgi:erythromycin esterase
MNINNKHINVICAVLIFLFSNKSVVFSQEKIKNYVKTNVFPVTTINPDSTNFNDLQSIGEAIGESRIVVLGEQNHGDAETFLAKSRLIKYLREKKGFSVLAFESDFYGLNEGWDQLKKEESYIKDFLLKNIYSVWSVCNSCSNLFYKYIPETYKTTSPLIVTGFDNQLFLNYSFNNLSAKFDSIIRYNKLPIVNNPNYESEILPLIDSSKKWDFYPPKDSIIINTSLKYLSEIKAQLKDSKNDNIFWELIIDNQISHIKCIKEKFVNPKYFGYERDNQMAINLKLLLTEKFKNKKVIVWAASSHSTKSSSSLKDPFYWNSKSMIEKLIDDSELKSDIYVMGFTSFGGRSGITGAKPYKLFKSKKNSFETWVNPSYKYAFVDFKKFNAIFPNSKEDFFLSALGHVRLEGKWNEIFDGVFYIKEMLPCIPIKR